MIKILTVIGARPQIIKAAAMNRTIQNKFSTKIHEIIVHTGQHYDKNMSEVFFNELNIPKSSYNLGVGSGLHGKQTAKMMEGIEELILKEKPDYLLVYGDTNSTLAGAVAASKLHVPVIHIEAGLRSFNRSMPEEVNRVVCDHLSTLLFSPTQSGYENLVKEGFNSANIFPFTPEKPGIFHCGDIMFDNSLYFSDLAEQKSTILSELNLIPDNFILTTIHRNHNTDTLENLNSIFKALIDISENYKIVIPLHPRTKNILNTEPHKKLLSQIQNTKNLLLIEPVSFMDIIQLESKSRLIITDSGGIQKEAYFFNKPCIILRPETEWIEILKTGNAKLASANYKKIMQVYTELIDAPQNEYPQIFGDGNAAEFICNTILKNE